MLATDTLNSEAKRQCLSDEIDSFLSDEHEILYTPNIQEKPNANLKWVERVFSSYLPSATFCFEVSFPKDCSNPFETKNQYFSYSMYDNQRVLSALVVKSVKMYLSAVLRPGDIILKVNETDFTGTPDEVYDFEVMKSKLASSNNEAFVIRFMRVGSMTLNFVPSPVEITLSQSDKNVAAKFIVVRDGSKPSEEPVSGTTIPTATTDVTGKQSKATGPLIQLLFLDSALPPAIKKMMQGNRVAWEHIPVFINATSLGSNTVSSNMPFSANSSSIYSQPVSAPPNSTPYYSFTGQHVVPTSSVHGPAKSGSLATTAKNLVIEKERANPSTAAAGGTAGTTDSATTTTTATGTSSNGSGGIFKDRNKWVVVLDVPLKGAHQDSSEEGNRDLTYHFNDPSSSKQVFLGRFDTLEEAKTVYRKAEGELRLVGTYSQKRLLRYLKSISFTPAAPTAPAAAPSTSLPTLSQSYGSAGYNSGMSSGMQYKPGGSMNHMNNSNSGASVAAKLQAKAAAIASTQKQINAAHSGASQQQHFSGAPVGTYPTKQSFAQQVIKVQQTIPPQPLHLQQQNAAKNAQQLQPQQTIGKYANNPQYQQQPVPPLQQQYQQKLGSQPYQPPSTQQYQNPSGAPQQYSSGNGMSVPYVTLPTGPIFEQPLLIVPGGGGNSSLGNTTTSNNTNLGYYNSQPAGGSLYSSTYDYSQPLSTQQQSIGSQPVQSYQNFPFNPVQSYYDVTGGVSGVSTGGIGATDSYSYSAPLSTQLQQQYVGGSLPNSYMNLGGNGTLPNSGTQHMLYGDQSQYAPQQNNGGFGYIANQQPNSGKK